MTDKIKSYAKTKYVAKKGKIITFDEYVIPNKDKLEDYRVKDFRYKGFDLLSWKHGLIQDEKINITDTEIKNNIKSYGHPIGKLIVPTIIEYNEDEQCYYGLHNPVLKTENGRLTYVGPSKLISGHCELLKYDELGHLVSIRFITLNEINEVVHSDSKCNKALIPFINQMIYINNYAVSH